MKEQIYRNGIKLKIKIKKEVVNVISDVLFFSVKLSNGFRVYIYTLNSHYNFVENDEQFSSIARMWAG